MDAKPSREEFSAEFKRLGMFEMSDDDFQRWREDVKERVRQRIERSKNMSEKERSDRVLMVIYHLADGRTDVAVPIEEARLFINRMGLLGMTDKEYRAWVTNVGDRVDRLRADAGRRPS